MADSSPRLALLAIAWAWSCTAQAQTAERDAWTYRIAPYLWGSAIEGNIAHARLPIDVRARLSFGDVLDNLDLGAMAMFEARKGASGLLADAMFTRLSSTVQVPVAGAALPVELRTRTATGLVAYQHRWRESAAGSLDLVAGVRVWSTQTQLSYALPIPAPPPVPQQYSGSQKETWLDLQIGLKGRREFANRWFLGGWALAGKGESDLSTDVMLLGGYSMSDRLSLAAGYRWLSTDYATSSGFRFDTTLQGPGIGLEYAF